MAKSTINWADMFGIGVVTILGFKFLPGMIKKIQQNNAKNASSTDPYSALRQQAASAVNTAGSAANSALSNFLKSLMNQQAQTGGQAGKGLGGGSGQTSLATARHNSQVDPPAHYVMTPKRMEQTIDQKYPALAAPDPYGVGNGGNSAVDAIAGSGGAIPILGSAQVEAQQAAESGTNDSNWFAKLLGIDTEYNESELDWGGISPNEETYSAIENEANTSDYYADLYGVGDGSSDSYLDGSWSDVYNAIDSGSNTADYYAGLYGLGDESWDYGGGGGDDFYSYPTPDGEY